MELFGYTTIRAHDVERVETGSWLLTSQANMNMPLGNPVDKARKEWKLPSRLWDDLPIPNTVAPSFETCNIARHYELEVRVGLAHGMAGGMRPELIVLPLRLQVQVYSGIAPPPKLLELMANNPHSQQPNKTTLFPRPVSSETTTSTMYSPPTTPLHEVPTPTTPFSELNIKSYPPHAGTYVHPHQAHHQHQSSLTGTIPDEAPPSYEDAMADDIDVSPADGPQRDYRLPSTGGVQQEAFNPDSKSGLGRRVSERLFAGNAPAAPSRSVSTPNVMGPSTIPEGSGPEGYDGHASGISGDGHGIMNVAPSPTSPHTTESLSRPQTWKRSFTERFGSEKGQG